MSDIIERAARVLNSVATSWGAADYWEKWREEAQALADAGLLRDNPAALLPPTEYNGELLCARCGVGQETGNRYHICADGSGWSHAETCEIYDYGDVFVCPPCEDEMSPARPTPTREEIAQHVADEHGFQAVHEADSDTAFCAKCGKWLNGWDYTKHVADAVLELLGAQPTIAEIKAAALEEAADELDALQTPENDHPSRRDPAAWLVDRAQQIREGK